MRHMRHNQVAKDGYQLTAREAPWITRFRETSQEEAELVIDLLSRRNWVGGKREVGIQRRQVKVRSRMAHSRQGTNEKLVIRIDFL